MSCTSESPVTVGCIGVDVTAARNDADLLRERAFTDELTGLPNRAGLRDHLARMSGSGASVVFCDLNGFKAVNDTHGHDIGDAVLVQVARRLRRTVRGEDFVARLGGDEFVIIAPPDPNSNFDLLARRILRATDQPMILPGPVVATIGMSIGMAVLEPGTDPTTALTLADHDMYQMKSRRATEATSAARQQPELDDSVLDRPQHCCGSARNPDLAVHVLDVMIGGLGRDEELDSDLAGRESTGRQSQHLDFSRRQPMDSTACLGVDAARPPSTPWPAAVSTALVAR